MPSKKPPNAKPIRYPAQQNPRLYPKGGKEASMFISIPYQLVDWRAVTSRPGSHAAAVSCAVAAASDSPDKKRCMRIENAGGVCPQRCHLDVRGEPMHTVAFIDAMVPFRQDT